MLIATLITAVPSRLHIADVNAALAINLPFETVWYHY